MINRLSNRPVYRQVADRLRERIERGQLQPGSPLPSEADLESEFGVGIGTIRRAVRVLVTEELVISEKGMPHRVADRSEPTIVVITARARISARVARPEDRRAHRVPEGSYIVVVDDGNGERVYPAASTIFDFIPDGGGQE